MKATILTIGTLLVLILGAVLLHATPSPRPAAPSPVPLAAPMPEPPAPPPPTTPPHQLGTVSVDPPSMVVGSQQPVIINLQNTDPDLIKSSVNLLEIPASGQAIIVGQLNDNGVNGDLTANDGIYTTTVNLSSFPVGTVTFRLSAAFAGALARVQSPNFSVLIFQPTSDTSSTTSWTTLTDSRSLFSIRVPSSWGLKMVGEESGGGGSFGFIFPNGVTAFTITIFTPADWTILQNSGFTSPEEIGQTNNYIFGWSEPQDEILVPGFNDDQIRSEFDDIIGTFQAH